MEMIAMMWQVLFGVRVPGSTTTYCNYLGIAHMSLCDSNLKRHSNERSHPYTRKNDQLSKTIILHSLLPTLPHINPIPTDAP